jgi:hypothetical protein
MTSHLSPRTMVKVSSNVLCQMLTLQPSFFFTMFTSTYSLRHYYGKRFQEFILERFFLSYCSSRLNPVGLGLTVTTNIPAAVMALVLLPVTSRVPWRFPFLVVVSFSSLLSYYYVVLQLFRRFFSLLFVVGSSSTFQLHCWSRRNYLFTTWRKKLFFS